MVCKSCQVATRPCRTNDLSRPEPIVGSNLIVLFISPPSSSAGDLIFFISVLYTYYHHDI